MFLLVGAQDKENGLSLYNMGSYIMKTIYEKENKLIQKFPERVECIVDGKVINEREIPFRMLDMDKIMADGLDMQYWVDCNGFVQHRLPDTIDIQKYIIGG